MPEVIEAPSTSTYSSICFDCANARAHLCDWVKNLTPVWKKAYKKTVSQSANKHEIYIVISCPRFVEEKKRTISDEKEKNNVKEKANYYINKVKREKSGEKNTAKKRNCRI